jgi:hypothetical protein
VILLGEIEGAPDVFNVLLRYSTTAMTDPGPHRGFQNRWW